MSAIILVAAQQAKAIELWSSENGNRYYLFDTALKWTSLLSYSPDDPLLYPERWSGTTLWRMRLSFGGQPASWVNFRIAYAQRARTVSEQSGAAGGSGFLLTTSRAPYRITQLDAPLVEVGNTFSHRHELDRAFAALHAGNVEVTVGRPSAGDAVCSSAPSICSRRSPHWRATGNGDAASMPSEAASLSPI